MSSETGNLSSGERMTSALIALGLAVVARRRSRTLVGIAVSAVAMGLVARAAAGHCGIKSAILGHSTLPHGLWDQWRCLLGFGQSREPLPGSPAHRRSSRSVDLALDESFPASDPPASHRPDEPPANAQAKWDARAKADSSKADSPKSDSPE